MNAIEYGEKMNHEIRKNKNQNFFLRITNMKFKFKKETKMVFKEKRDTC